MDLEEAEERIKTLEGDMPGCLVFLVIVVGLVWGSWLCDRRFVRLEDAVFPPAVEQSESTEAAAERP